MSRFSSLERFRKARWLADMHSIWSFLAREEDRLIAFEEVTSLTPSKKFASLGLRTIKVDDVIGSEDRYEDFNRNFFPLKDALKERWARIDELSDGCRALPPIEVYKAGDYYFVRDGNHRVSVAKARKQVFIDAYVTELVLDTPITKRMTAEDRLLIQRHQEFNEATGIMKWGKGMDINLTRPEFYDFLSRMIRRYGELHPQEPGETFQRKAKRWYFDVFLPFAEDCYLNDLLANFRDRTTGDLYVWLQMNFDKIAPCRDSGDGVDFLEKDLAVAAGEKGEAGKTSLRELEKLRSVLAKRSTHPENYFFNDYLSIAVLNVLLSLSSGGGLEVLLVKRKYHPNENMWSLPFSMLNKNETRREACLECVGNVLGSAPPLPPVHFATLDRTDRNPFGRIMAFCCLGFSEEADARTKPVGIAKEIGKFAVEDVPPLVYDHRQVIVEAMRFLCEARREFSTLSRIFPPEFTLKKTGACIRSAERHLASFEASKVRPE